MKKLLYIQASPRKSRSHSIAVADEFIATFKHRNPADRIITLNLFDTQLPPFDGLTIRAKYTILHGRQHSKAEENAWKQVENIINQFKAADKYLIATPMWNFSIPYPLKHYIDILVQPGYTFSYDPKTGYHGLILGKPLAVIYARGGEYSPEAGTEQFDLQKKYIELIFGFIGFKRICSIIVEPTLQGTRDLIAAKKQAAINLAQETAADF